ncbi:outer membrane beta-barrel protein [Taibaiella lutea]|uniref:Outer membrane beta-barrel protein n=1 Tax=Taibaiella lutea TaxID=2608001 RepID=A0A5M6CQ01_9BACT|nr:TonB-dependent receptor [Taibaiella lutea]KAA5536470.1 outer membrane beta-barrel protein [Taibaiella lutea]
MKRLLFLSLVLILCSSVSFADNHLISGTVKDTAGSGLGGATVSLLDPSDSTLVKFSITNNNGNYAIPDIGEGKFLLQIAMMGFYTEYKTIEMPSMNPAEFNNIILKENPDANVLNEVIISGEKVPVRVIGDTLEYNAGSYKVKPDAVVEDLLRKLPGMQVDENGNIKAMGKDVKKVLVDGKEFFGDDPKVATKNLPADAIEKVQTYEKKSDESLFTGIDDGERDQTINLQLKAGKKAGYFGEVMGGIGVPEHYDASLKAFKFREKSQVAVLGMANNINKFGFTFEDYLNFNGGIGSLLKNGRLEMNADDVPVDFGQPVTGKMNTQALGLNYGLLNKPTNRFNVSYMGYGLQKLLEQKTHSINYTANGNFEKQDLSNEKTNNYNNGLSSSWYNQLDSSLLLTASIHGQLTNKDGNEALNSQSYLESMVQNSLTSASNSNGDIIKTNGSVSLVKKMKGKWPMLQLQGEGSYSNNKDNNKWLNNTKYLSGQEYMDQQFQNNKNTLGSTALNLSIIRNIGKGYYLKPFAGLEYNNETSIRNQGPSNEGVIAIDSLSPDFNIVSTVIKGGLELKKNNKKTQSNIGLKFETLQMQSELNGTGISDKSYRYMLPYAFWQREIASGTRLGIRYNTQINTPRASQLLPTTDYSNPLFLRSGNAFLKPEYEHSLNLNYNRFDQFTMSTFFVSMDGKYTKDKIGWNQTVSTNLVQKLTTANLKYDWNAGLSAYYARPVQKIKLNFNVSIKERFDQSISQVNYIDNVNKTFNHTLELSVNNLNNNILDARIGGNINISSTQYSINTALNTTYTNYTGFAKVNYRPVKNWSFLLSMDMTHYTSQSYDQPITIPLMKAEITRYVFANQRGAITLKGFDLLNKNKSILRVSQLNYFIEQQSSIIGRYALLSFSYKLNKIGQGNAVNIRL